MGDGQKEVRELPLTGRRIEIDQTPTPRPASARLHEIEKDKKRHYALSIDYTQRQPRFNYKKTRKSDTDKS